MDKMSDADNNSENLKVVQSEKDGSDLDCADKHDNITDTNSSHQTTECHSCRDCGLVYKVCHNNDKPFVCNSCERYSLSAWTHYEDREAFLHTLAIREHSDYTYLNDSGCYESISNCDYCGSDTCNNGNECGMLDCGCIDSCKCDYYGGYDSC